MFKESLMQELNPQQKEAIEYSEGPLLVLAGAGSGKTRVVTNKFAYIVKNKKCHPESILAVTFTNKAANEMKERIRNILGRDLRSSWIGTLHSQCTRILRNNISSIGYTPDFSIYDEEDRCRLIRHILKEFRMYEALYKGVSARINLLKASLVGPDEFLSSGDGYGFDEKLAKVYVRYQDELKRSNALDFDDLIMLTVRMFQECPDILNKYRQYFAYVLVDEFQDLNHAQYNLIKLLSSEHICAVGDDDQSIYKFRGADVNHIRNFEKDFPGAKIIRLERNYRSTQNIISVANAVISRNVDRREKNMWTDKGCGEKVYYCWLNTEEEEAKYIAKMLKDLYLKGEYTYSDMAILYRVNLQARALEDAMRETGLPYHIIGGISFYQRKEIKDLIAYVRLIINNGDNVSLRRILNVPPRGIGSATLSKIENEAKKKSISLFESIKQLIAGNSVVPSTKEKLHRFISKIESLSSISYKNASDMLKIVAEETGYLSLLDEERRQNIDELISSAETRDIKSFIDKISLMTNLDEATEEKGISLLTLHNAKGLEFPVVLIAGVEEGLLPYFKADGNNEDISEERRLFYVGMTRAKDILMITGAKKRRLYSKIQDQEPSRFLADIPKEHCCWIEKTVSNQTRKFSSTPRTVEPKKIGPLFSSGCRVKHPVWGVGVVRDCYGEGEDQKVMVNFPAIGMKRLSLKLANLTRI